jgi:hypothetical protein
VLKKLEASIQAGNFYEAEQMTKTVYYRYRTRKMLEDSYQIVEVRSLHTEAPPHAPLHVAPATITLQILRFLTPAR